MFTFYHHSTQTVQMLPADVDADNDDSDYALMLFLHTQLPNWLTGLDSIARTVKQRQEERMIRYSYGTSISSCFEIVYLDNGDLQKVVTPPTSNDSIRTPTAEPRIHVESVADSVYGRGQRPRQTLTLIYDSNAQIFLTTLFNDLSRARNMIRKRQMQMRAGNNTARQTKNSFRWSQDDIKDTPEDESDIRNLLSRIRRRRRPAAQVEREKEMRRLPEPLDEVSDRMGRMQDLCHVLAFELLRDGNCLAHVCQAVREMNGLHIWVVQELARREAAILVADVWRRDSTLSSDAGSKRISILSDMSVTLESSEDEEDLVLPPVRLTSRMGRRGG